MSGHVVGNVQFGAPAAGLTPQERVAILSDIVEKLSAIGFDVRVVRPKRSTRRPPGWAAKKQQRKASREGAKAAKFYGKGSVPHSRGK